MADNKTSYSSLNTRSGLFQHQTVIPCNQPDVDIYPQSFLKQWQLLG